LNGGGMPGLVARSEIIKIKLYINDYNDIAAQLEML
jgi:hypothetical protein